MRESKTFRQLSRKSLNQFGWNLVTVETCWSDEPPTDFVKGENKISGADFGLVMETT